MTKPRTFHLQVNGAAHQATDYPMARLLDVLRERLKLTGTKEGCGEGECGACSVIMNGRLVNSCLVPLAEADGAEIRTIEAVEADAKMKILQDAFIDRGGAQCGICTPGMLMASIELLERNTTPTDSEIRVALAGNICRCTGYTKIFEAVALAARQIQEAR